MHTDVHETIPDWMDKSIEELAGKRAIAITVGGTTIDGELEYRWFASTLTSSPRFKPGIPPIVLR